MTGSTHTLRRSCHFCRTRKIRCSGDSICEACRERGHDCVYDAETARGRPKGSGGGRNDSVDSESSSPQPPSLGPLQSSSILPPEQSSPSISRSMSESGWQVPNSVENTIGNALRTMFVENFSGYDFSPENLYQKKIAAFSRAVSTDQSLADEAAATTKARMQHLDYEQGLYHIPQDLVSMLATKFGNLGSQYIDDGGAKACIHSLARDTTTDMFDDATSFAYPSPLNDLDPRRASQMIDVWFSSHPLSPIISKTLLLRNVRSKTFDEALFAVMMAGALTAHYGDEADASKVQSLLQWATGQIDRRCADQCFDQKLSTVQTLMLLGWDDLCHDRVRRAVCNIGFAGRLVATLTDPLNGDPANSRSRVNGIDIRVVEKELVINAWWISFMLTQWFFMQMDEQIPGKPSQMMPPDFPPLDSSQSALVTLDEASDNVSTLRIQKQALRTMWPLSHITSVNAHIYALLPRDFAPPNEGTNSASWHERPLQQLRSLLDFRPTRDVSSICVHIVSILQGSIGNLHREIKDPSTLSIILTVHHTILIHMMFPWGAPAVGITDARLRQLLASAESLLRIFSDAPVTDKKTRPGSTPDAALLRVSFPEVFVMGLDACARAMERFYDQTSGVSEFETRLLESHATSVTQMAHQCYAATKTELLSSVKSLRPVKKRLKNFCNLMGASHPLVKEPVEAIRSPFYDFGTAAFSTIKQNPIQSIPPNFGFNTPIEVNNIPDNERMMSVSRKSARTYSGSSASLGDAAAAAAAAALPMNKTIQFQPPQPTPVQRPVQTNSRAHSLSAASSRSQSAMPDSSRSRSESIRTTASPRQTSTASASTGSASTAPTDFSSQFDLSSLEESSNDWEALGTEAFGTQKNPADMSTFEEFMLGATAATTIAGMVDPGTTDGFAGMFAGVGPAVQVDPYAGGLAAIQGSPPGVLPERGGKEGQSRKRPRS